jgi:flagellar biosynthesis/type III secretory pathway M-ring protein FliF/YscJ
LNVSDDATNDPEIGLIVGIVSSLMIVIICFIVFLIVKKIRKQIQNENEKEKEKEKEEQKDILYEDFTLDDDDQTSIITVTATCAISEDTLPTQLLSVIHPSDFCDQSTVDDLSLLTNGDLQH